MPKLSKPVQGFLVLGLGIFFGTILMLLIGNNEDEGFLGTTQTTEIEVIATEEPTDGQTSPEASATPDAETTPEPEGTAEPEATEEPIIVPPEGTPPPTISEAQSVTITQEYKAPLGADANLVFQGFMFFALLFGASFAVRKDFVSHRNTMTFLITLNWFSIFGRMLRTLNDLDLETTTANPNIVRAHVGLGTLIVLFATYLAFRMWFEKRLPDWIKINPIKPYMRLTLILWLLNIILGFTIYFGLYS